jgi:hypothetical protein
MSCARRVLPDSAAIAIIHDKVLLMRDLCFSGFYSSRRALRGIAKSYQWRAEISVGDSRNLPQLLVNAVTGMSVTRHARELEIGHRKKGTVDNMEARGRIWVS